MSKVFNANKELTRPTTPPLPFPQKDGKRKDGTERKPKWKVRSIYQGCIPANQYLWWYYYGDIPKGYTPIFIDGNPLNNTKDNLMLLTYKELKSFVSINNPYYLIDNGEQRKMALGIIKSTSMINDIERSMKKCKKQI